MAHVSSSVSTRLGAVSLRSYGGGAPTGASETMIALPGMAALGEPDWHAVASSLASKSLRVLLPLPHSNAKTAPSVFEFAVAKTVTGLCGLLASNADTIREDWLLDIMPDDGSKVILAGFSWGGGAACRFAARYPEKVSKLVLVSPDVQHMVAQKVSVPTLLIWSTRDPINPYFWTRRFRGLGNITLQTTDTFGHEVRADHSERIRKWLVGEG